MVLTLKICFFTAIIALCAMMAIQLLDTLPETDARMILQMDIWYTCKALWDKALEKSITLIGAMKTNRILDPDSHRCSAQDHAVMLPKSQYRDG